MTHPRLTYPRLGVAPLLLALLLTAFSPLLQTNPSHGRPKTQARPALSGPVKTYDTEHFLIHYTLKGEDTVSSKDDDGNDLPDFVEAVAEALEFSWQREVEAMGWRPPLSDEGEGGDSKLDVYLEDQSDPFGSGDLFGYTDTFGGFVGDNPTTEKEEANSAYGYLSLDNDYDPDQFDLYELDPLDAMRTTAAHEFNHAIQSAYDDGDPYAWIYEATAVWMEDELYPELGGARSYLADYMDAPDLCPFSVGRDDQDVRWYGGWILLRYLAEQHGGPETIRRLWENMAALDGLAALAATLREQNINLSELLVNFAVANLLKSDCPANAPYCYAHGSDYLRPYVEGSLRVEAGATKTFVPKDGVQHFGVDYIRLKSDSPIRLAFRGSPAGEWQLRLVGLTGETAKVIPWIGSSPTSVDPSTFEKLYLVIVNTAPAEAEEDCGYHNYTLALTATGNNDPLEAPPLPRDPGSYVPPAYLGGKEGVAPTPVLNGGQPIRLEEAPFPPFYPGYLPPGYSLSGLFSYTSANLDEWAQDYAPGGEPILGLIYNEGENPDDYLAIIQSPAPPQTLAEWVKTMGYLETDIRLVNDHELHLVEYHDESGRLSVATFIQHDRFIVVEAPFDLIEMQQVVAGFLSHNP